MSDVSFIGSGGIIPNRNVDGWRSMSSAPRDGTYVELKCSYGVAPWYCIARWTDEHLAVCPDGTTIKFKAHAFSWVQPEGGGPFDEISLLWRPYVGDVASYVDPTGGMQNDPAYWRAAIAKKYGVSVSSLEAIAARNAERSPGAPIQPIPFQDHHHLESEDGASWPIPVMMCIVAVLGALAVIAHLNT